MNKLHHPNIVQLFGVALFPELAIVIELAGGGDLSKLLARERLAVITNEVTLVGVERGKVPIAEGEIVSVMGSGDEVVLMMKCERCSVTALCCGCVVCGQWFCGSCCNLAEWKRFFFFSFLFFMTRVNFHPITVLAFVECLMRFLDRTQLLQLLLILSSFILINGNVKAMSLSPPFASFLLLSRIDNLVSLSAFVLPLISLVDC